MQGITAVNAPTTDLFDNPAGLDGFEFVEFCASAHAIAEAVQRVRGDRGSFALVGANGGWMSKYATGIYSTTPADWSGNDRFAVLPKATDKVPLAKEPVTAATVET